MSNWRPDSPVELPDGTLVCKAHRLVVCGRCICDYSFMQELDSQSEASDFDDNPGSGDLNNDEEFHSNTNTSYPPQAANLFLPSILGEIRSEVPPADTGIPDIRCFIPAGRNSTPQALFPAKDSRSTMLHRRFLRGRQMLIYTDGACLNNGQANPRAGCAFVFRDAGLNALGERVSGTVSFRLENKGPSGLIGAQTSNRAELRAVIAALQYRVWYGMGETKLVIATDSEYITLGITEWVHGWDRNGWHTRSREPVKNQDLWKALLAELRQYMNHGMEVTFWRIPREFNTVADQAAKEAATQEERSEFCRILGFMV